ncbi:MAG: glycosyltransferase family 2 protein, partial [Cyanobacteria bacterium J06627_15]
LRWSDAWETKSLKHFRKKWNLEKDKYFRKRYRRLGHRRHAAFLRPLIRKLTFGQAIPWLENWVIGLERQLNQVITNRYKQQKQRRQDTQAAEQITFQDSFYG